MNRLFSLLFIFSFLSLAVFGALAINDANGQIHKSCIVALAAGMDCPNWNVISYIAFHLNALKSFSETTLNSGFLNIFILLALALSVSVGFLFSRKILLALQTKNSSQKLRLLPVKISFSNPALKRWHSLHENSPSVF